MLTDIRCNFLFLPQSDMIYMKQEIKKVPLSRMPHSSIAGSVSGLSVTSRTSRVSHATTIRSVATLTDTLKTKTGLSIPILPDAVFTNVQRGSVLAATYSIVSAVKGVLVCEVCSVMFIE